jgi:phospholipase/carboxylesterase
MLRFLDEVTQMYPTPEGKLIVSGFSQGALMALDAGLRTTQKIAGIVAMSGGLYEPDLPDLRARAGLPVLMAHGSVDEVVPVHYARRARRLLEDAGIDVEYHEYPMGHQVAAEEAADVRAFLAKVIARSGEPVDPESAS